MAFDSAQLVLMGHGNGFKNYRYDTLDPLTTVDNNGYINNSDDNVNLAKGDLIDVVVWTTAIRTGTVADVGKHVVYGVAANGDVNLSDDLTGWGITSGD